MYVNGSGFCAIERVKKVHHTTVINWVKQLGSTLPNTPYRSEIPEVTEVDELETFIGSKKNKIWLWTVVNHSVAGIIAWVLGDRSSETCKHLWIAIKCWQSYFYVTDGYPVYPCFISNEDHIVSKTYMTRVEGENSRLRHYLQGLHRKTFCYSKTEEMLKYSIRVVIHYLKYGSFVAHGGTLLLITRVRDTEVEPSGPPWPLSDSELAQFENVGLQQIEKLVFLESEVDVKQVRIEYQRHNSLIDFNYTAKN